MAASPVLRVVLATQNHHKVGELMALLHENAVDLVGRLTIVSLAELGVHDDVVEDGADYSDNALIKARAAYAATGLWALADDSGLSVDALNGAPGVYSARYGGEPRSDGRNLAALLTALADVPAERRGARFICSLCLYGPASPGTPPAPGDPGTPGAPGAPGAPLVAGEAATVRLRSGECTGTLRFSPVGTQGFGYDPLFVPDPGELAAAGLSAPDLAGKTYAELSAAQKNQLSHRTRATRAMVPLLRALCDGLPLPL